MLRKARIYTDGASRGNPGEAAIGVAIEDDEGDVVASISRRIGLATNNEAEYAAVIAALEKAAEMGVSEVVLMADSELVVKQLRGEYKVKKAHLKPLIQRVLVLGGRFESLTVRHIPRSRNARADALANKAFGLT